MGRGLSQQTKDIIELANRLWTEEFQPRDITPTVRQLFYEIAVAKLVPKDERGYGKVQTVLARARERGAFPMEGIYDGLRQLRRPNVWNGLDAYLEVIRRSYRRDPWQDQPRRVEVWIEKDAVRGTVQSVTTEYQVPLLCGRGYLSITAKNEARQRIARRATTIVYIGDHDPSGINMLEETEEWIRGELPADADLVIDRIAITDEDHANDTLPDLPVNPKDARAANYIRRYGDTVVEVEAVSAVALQDRLRTAIERHRDDEAWAEGEKLEKEDREELNELLGDEAA